MVRRPMLYAAVSLAASILIFQYLGRLAAFLTIIVLLCCCFFMIKPNKAVNGRIIIVILFYIIGTCNVAAYKAADNPVVDAAGSNISVEGKVGTSQELINFRGDRYTKFCVRITSVNRKPIDSSCKILAWDYSDMKIKPGDTVKLTGYPELPDERKNPKCFDYRLYLESTGIRAVMRDVNTEILVEGKGIRTVIYNKKEGFRKLLEKKTDSSTAGMVQGIMFGDKNGIQDETLEEFQQNGTAHILAVSGLHIGIIYGFISFLWPWRKKVIFFIFVSVFFCVYVVLADFAPSVIRAVFMVEMHTFAKLTDRRYDLSSAAFTIAVVMLMINPMQLFHIGFQMSFLAVLSLALLLPYINKIHNGILAGGIAIQVGMTPLTAFAFNYLSIAGIFVNVFVIFLAGIIVPLGLIALFCMGISDDLFLLSGNMLSYLCALLEKANHITCINGITVFNVVSPPVGFLSFYYLSLLVFFSEEGRLMFLRKQGCKIIICLMCIVLASAAFDLTCKSGFEKSDLIFVDVGQGDCMHFKTDEGGDYLIDGGGTAGYEVGKKTLKPYLLKNGVREIDGAFVTHLHTDHYKGIVELCREGMVKRLYLYEGNKIIENRILKETGLSRDEISYLSSGSTVELGEDVHMDVLWPKAGTMTQYRRAMENEEDENSSSLVFRLCIKGVTLIATGDVDEECQDRIAGQWGRNLKTNILKVSHHGSKYSYSPKFNMMTNPEYAVFQVGKNNFGHPDGQVIDNYREKGGIILRNDIQGAIGFDINEDIKYTVCRGDN